MRFPPRTDERKIMLTTLLPPHKDKHRLGYRNQLSVNCLPFEVDSGTNYHPDRYHSRDRLHPLTA